MKYCEKYRKERCRAYGTEHEMEHEMEHEQ
jgi:hypothetical protein